MPAISITVSVVVVKGVATAIGKAGVAKAIQSTAAKLMGNVVANLIIHWKHADSQEFVNRCNELNADLLELHECLVQYENLLSLSAEEYERTQNDAKLKAKALKSAKNR